MVRDDTALAQIRDRNESTPLLLRGAAVVTMDDDLGDFATGDVLLQGSRILAVGADLGDTPLSANAIVVDCTDLILAPGFHDTHRHAWQGQLRRYLPDVDLDGYLANVHATMAHHYRPSDMYAGNLVSALGAIDAGVTTMLDFSHNSRSSMHSDAAIAAWAETGLRVVHASSAPMDGDWDKQWPDDLGRILEGLPDTGLITLRMALLPKVVDIIPDLVALNQANLELARGLGIEVSVDGVFGDEASRQVENLHALGNLGPDITYIHCTDLSDAAWRAVLESGGHVSLAPTSDAQIGMASGLTPVQKCIDLDIAPSIGIDVECCLATDMFSNMRAILTVQRMNVHTRRAAGDPSAPALLTDREVLSYATMAGARANGLGAVSGSITPGKEADLIAVRSTDVNLFPLNNVIGTLVQGADARNIEMVFIAGRPVKWQGQVLGVDLGEARALAEESRDHLFASAGVELDPLPTGIRS